MKKEGIFKKLVSYYAPYKVVFFIDLGCAALISLVDLAYPQILRVLARTLFAQSAEAILGALLPLAAALLAMYLTQSLCKYYVSYHGHMMGANMERDMRQDLFDHYERLSFSYYDKNNSGQMMSKLVSDLFDIAEAAHHGPENLFISVVKVAGSFIFLSIICWQLAVPLAVVVVVMAIFCARQSKNMRRTFMENRRRIGDVNASLQDTLSGIRVVQSFANEDMERAKFSKSNNAFLHSKDENYKCMGLFQGSNAFFLGLMYLVTIVFGGLLIAHGKMQAGDLAMFALYIGVFIHPIQMLIELMEMTQKGLSGFRRFVSVMETEPDIRNCSSAVPLTSIKGEIAFRDVSFSYGETSEEVLSHVSFTIPAGKSVALVGPSGSGKTTICSLIPRFYDATSGSVEVDGRNVKSIELKSLRQQIGIVQQDVYLFWGTLRENIAYGKPGATDAEIVEAAKRANIHDFIMSLPEGYDTFTGERGVRLSGGQKQRISIARVFLKNPPVLILDEATSALDNESERLVQKSLEALAKNRTTLTIAHRLSTIRNADEILVVADAGIAERGTHDALMAKDGIYASYYRLQYAG